jgi:NAD(P)-dependent dehydrogenase (short-subunit alcohol dehydrogenase family)
MKVLVQGLGEVPATLELALEKVRPDITYIISSEYLAKKTATFAGYTEPNEVVVRRAAEKTNTRVIFKFCDVLDLASVCAAVAEVIREFKSTDEIVINYTGGAANVKLFLGAVAVGLTKLLNVRIVYALRYGDVEVFKDQTEEFKKIFKQLYEFI